MGMAREKDLDLVEVSPNANPPVCKIISWSKFLYEQKKKEKEARKNKQKEMKEFRFGTFIAEGDKVRQITRAREFLEKGHNVKLTVTRKGRTPVQQSRELLNDLLTRLSEYSTIDPNPTVEGRRVSIIIKSDSTGTPVKKGTSNAKAQDKQNSGKKVQDDKASGEQKPKDSVQQEQTGTSEDEKVSKGEK